MSRRPVVQRAIDMQIAQLSSEGFGRGAIDAREIRLRNALPGETVQGLVRKRRRRIDYGDVLIVGEPSPAREKAVCAVTHRCGGCTFQHTASEFELSWKEAQLHKSLDRAGVMVNIWRAPVGGPLHGYRRKARLGVRRVGDMVFVGFREAFSGRVVDMQTCSILDARLASLIAPLRAWLGELTVASQIPQIELAAGDLGVSIVVRNLQPLTPGDRWVLQSFASQQQVEVYLQPSGPGSLVWLAGRGEQLGYSNHDFGLHFTFEPLDFVQVNPFINRQIVRASVLALGHAKSVIDLFCGIGNFSLALARAGKSVLGLEGSESAVERARVNSVRNGLAASARFRAAELYDSGFQGVEFSREFDGMLLDPPRLGAGPQLSSWLHPGLHTVVYVSCNPESFAKDAVVFGKAGFQLDEVGIHDMFPQTTHVETLGVFRRK